LIFHFYTLLYKFTQRQVQFNVILFRNPLRISILSSHIIEHAFESHFSICSRGRRRSSVSSSKHTLEDNTAHNLSFGQEQIPIPAIQAVTSGGGPGVADTLAGSAISTLLAAANPCAKVQHLYANESDTTLTTHSFKKPTRLSPNLAWELMPSKPLRA
jgi:hypothetical protein